MIVFCEDCGGKNTLPLNEIIDKRAVFKCICCAYANNYSLQPSDGKNEYDASDLFDHLAGFKDILGLLVYHRQTGIIRHNFKQSFADHDLDAVGALLLQNMDVCLKANLDIEQITLYISNFHTTVRPINTECIMIIVGATQKALHLTSGMFKKLVIEYNGTTINDSL